MRKVTAELALYADSPRVSIFVLGMRLITVLWRSGRAGVLPEAIEKDRLQGTIAGNGVGRVRIEGAAVHIVDRAARLVNEHHPARHIPDVIVEGPVAVESAAGEIGEVEG